jgi:hypothetical protein
MKRNREQETVSREQQFARRSDMVPTANEAGGEVR